MAWRFYFVVGSMAHALVGPERVETMLDQRGIPSDGKPLIDRLLPFAVAGMSAPVPGAEETP